MRIPCHLFPIAVVSLAAVVATVPGKLLSSLDACQTTLPAHEDEPNCSHCAHHRKTAACVSAKVDADACPDAKCTAPCEIVARAPLTLEQRSGLGLPMKKRASVTEMVRKALEDQKKLLQVKDAELSQWGLAVQTQFAHWFGTTQAGARDRIRDRIHQLLELNDRYTEANFRRSEDPSPGIFAYVRPADPSKVFLDDAFIKAPPVGINSRAGTLVHEMSHFRIVGGTRDHAYGQVRCRLLARSRPDLALENADSFEYFIETSP